MVVIRSGKTKKKDKSQKKMWVFEKKSENLIEFEKRQTLSIQIYKIPCFLKSSNG